MAALVGLCACGKTPEPTTAAAAGPAISALEAAASAVLAATVTPEAAAAVAAGSVSGAAIAWRKPRSEAEVHAVFAEARQLGQPVFLYWGAAWCPACNQVKATVFNRPDFIDKSRSFVPVYLDGDEPGAQKLGARFKVRGYPTTLLLRADGSEITRLPGEVDAQKYLQLLALGLGGARPVKESLALAQDQPARLGAADWRLLAYYAWHSDEQQLVAQGQLAATLERLALACPNEQAEAGLRLLLKSRVARAQESAASASGRSGAAKPAPPAKIARAFGAGQRAPHGDAALTEKLLGLLADDALARQNADIVLHDVSELTGQLTAPGSGERERLTSVWAATLDRFTADPRLSQGQRMDALVARVALARLGLPEGAALSPVLQEHVRRHSARAEREVTSDTERQSVMPSAAHALAEAGLLADADRLLEAELLRSHSPYYAMLQLAANARQRGDKPAALGWYERAYKASRGAATRAQWGAGYVNALLELAPADTERIARAAASVLGELEGQPDVFYDRTARTLERMSTRLVAWGNSGQSAAVLARLREQRDRLCASLPAGDTEHAACSALLPPAPAPRAPAARRAARSARSA